MDNISIILPSYKPDEKLLLAVKALEDEGFNDIIVVNDGSGEEFADKFAEVEKRDSVTLLVHPVNRGKGAALKTAFKYCLENRKCSGVVTVDGDGQHLPKDVKACGEEMVSSGKIVLGCRDFSLPFVPGRSRRGNRLTSKVFKLFVHMECSDTQTGLRAIPYDLLEFMLTIPGDRYEYETNMLLYMKREGHTHREVTIETVYINENETSHFHPFRDSFRIYWQIVKFLFTSTFMLFLYSSMICYAVDWVIFTILVHTLANRNLSELFITVFPYILARAVSSIMNYFINRKVFKCKGKVANTIFKYYALAVSIFVVGSIAVMLVQKGLLGIPYVADAFPGETGAAWLKSIIKPVIDVVLYIISYNVQKKVVFPKKNSEVK